MLPVEHVWVFPSVIGSVAAVIVYSATVTVIARESRHAVSVSVRLK